MDLGAVHLCFSLSPSLVSVRVTVKLLTVVAYSLVGFKIFNDSYISPILQLKFVI